MKISCLQKKVYNGKDFKMIRETPCLLEQTQNPTDGHDVCYDCTNQRGKKIFSMGLIAKKGVKHLCKITMVVK